MDQNREVLISGTRYKAKHLAAENFQFGWSAEELLRQHPDLQPEQVCSVLTWFYDHRAEVIGNPVLITEGLTLGSIMLP